MPTPRVLVGMSLGALVAALGALFLGEYEFDELLPILSGALLGLIVAEVVVSVGRLRALPLALVVAAWSATAVVLAGYLDANDTEPIKSGAYLSAGLAAVAALARANDWRRTRDQATTRPDTEPADAGTRSPAGDEGADVSIDDEAKESPGTGQRRPDEEDWPAIPAAPARTRSRTARRIGPETSQPPASSSDSPWQRPEQGSAEPGRIRVTARPRRRTDRDR